MAGWWHLLGVYVVAGVFAGVIGWRLLKADAPPGVAYVTFASFARHPQGGPEDVASPPNDGMPVQRRPCFAHDRRPGVEATGGGGLFLLPRCPRTGGVISERVCACPPS